METDEDREAVPENLTLTTVLLGAFEREVDYMTKEMMRHLMSELKESGVQSINYNRLRSILREDLVQFVRGLLGIFDNHGAVLPGEVIGFEIIESESKQGIGNGMDDYWQLWLDYVEAASRT